MTRHARNSTAGSVYTYHEKKKDGNQSGYGTNTARLGKDSVRNFDCCCLTLQRCQDPVITKDGYLFDKAAILQYVITKKKEAARQTRRFAEQKESEAKELTELNESAKIDKINSFVQQESTITTPSRTLSNSTPEAGTSISNMAAGKEKNVPSFWIPSRTPVAKKAPMTKPDTTVYCPMTGKPLKMKDLIDVKFTEITKDPTDKRSKVAAEVLYMCPITRDSLGNSVPCAVIRTTGDVVTMDCVEKIIKKDWTHPLTGDKLREQDIIPLQRGATGFAETNTGLEAKQARPVLQA